VLEEDPQDGEIIARVAALDIGKAEVVCCVRVPDEDKPGRRLQEVKTYSTMTRRLLAMSDHLRCLGVTRVVMEATSDYWKPVFYLLEAQGLEPWLVTARDVKHLLAATDGADVGVVGCADENRASRAVLVLMVAARSAR
jgi:transposase